MNLLSLIDGLRSRPGRSLLTAVLTVVATAQLAAAASWHVAPDGNDLNPGSPAAPFATIQHAIAAADSGDIVLLADGVYGGIGNRQVTFLGKAITVRSASGRREDCVVRAQGFDGFVFQMGETATSILADLTITGADQGVAIFGGATRPHLNNCVIDSCGTGVDVSGGNLTMTDCAVSRSAVGILIRDNAGSAEITGTNIFGNSGPGVRTTGLWTCYGSRGLQLIECKLTGNGGTGLEHGAAFGGASLRDCDVSDNNGWGATTACPGDFGISVYGGRFHNNGAGGISNSGSAWDHVEDCEVDGNGGPGILSSWDAYYGVINCIVHDNASHGISFGNGPPAAAKEAPNVAVSGCVVYRNGGCGLDFDYVSQYVLVSGCVVYDNVGPGLRLTMAEDSSQRLITVLASTFVGNAHGLQLSSDLPISVERTLIAFNDGAAVDCTTQPQVTLTCSDLYGNPGGDWTGPIAPQAGIAGNFSADPRFVDATNGDYRLLDISPCAPGHAGACGRIGALDVGAWAAPRLLALTDVGGDQGGQLRLQWAASYFDRPGAAQPVTGYGVYRRQDAAAIAKSTATPRADKLLGWDFIAMVPSRGDTGYQIVAPTLVDAPAPGDSTGAWSVFMVSAMTADPLTFHDSAPDSGVSRDDLAPATPLALHMEGVRRLVWDDCRDADFTRFAIYGSLTGARDGTEVPLGQTTATTFNVRDLVYPYFLVAAVDRHGNLSVPALWAPAAGADDTPAAASLALRPCHPNPFNPSTTLSFTLPQGGPARVAVYDVAGRAVRTLLDTTLGAGAHDATWDGRDDAGRAVSAGGYVARLEFGTQERSVRMTLVK